MPEAPESKQPLAEVFGFPVHDQSAEAKRHRSKRLCPFNNKVPNCTKDKAKNPLGVCSVREGNESRSPVRFASARNGLSPTTLRNFSSPPMPNGRRLPR